MTPKRRNWLLGGIAAVPLTYHVLIGFGAAEASSEPGAAPYAGEVTIHPDREAYFGDLHLHTANSFISMIFVI